MRQINQPIPTAARVRELFNYDPETGFMTWRIDRRRCKKGTRAGSIHYQKSNNHYRRRIFVDNEGYQEHRIIWLYMTGEWPTAQIDHKDRDATNNRWENLRLDPHLRNNRNRRKLRSNTSGYPGVGRRKNGYAASIVIGTFPTAEEAHEAYKSASLHLHGEFSPYYASNK